MPLHTQNRTIGMFDGLDYAVGVVCRYTKIFAKMVDGLVVQGVGFEAVAAEDLVECGIWQDLDGAKGQRGVWMRVRKIKLFDLWMECTAKKEVDQLHSPAYSKDGQIPLVGFGQKLHLHLVTFRLALHEELLPIEFGADIDSSCDE